MLSLISPEQAPHQIIETIMWDIFRRRRLLRTSSVRSTQQWSTPWRLARTCSHWRQRPQHRLKNKTHVKNCPTTVVRVLAQFSLQTPFSPYVRAGLEQLYQATNELAAAMKRVITSFQIKIIRPLKKLTCKLWTIAGDRSDGEGDKGAKQGGNKVKRVVFGFLELSHWTYDWRWIYPIFNDLLN